MPRKPFENSSEFPFHITARSINKEWWLPMDEVWEVMENYLSFLTFGFEARLHAFVLMNNHYHLLATFPLGNISQSMNYFMRETSRCMTRPAGRINQTYGSRFFRSLIKSELYYLHAYKYIYRNPVEAGICSSVEDYPYSTLYGLLGRGRLNILMDEDFTLFSSFEETLRWLNRKPLESHREAIRKALRKPEFTLPKDRFNKKTHPLSYLPY